MSRQTQFPKYDVMGLEVDSLTRAEAASYIVTWLQDGTNPAALAIKPYVEFVERASRDTEVRQLLQSAELCLADGVALQWATHFLYRSNRRWWALITTLGGIVFRPSTIADPLPERFSGITFTLEMLQACQSHNLSVFLIGSPIHSNISRTATVMSQKYPGLKIAGTFPGHFSNTGERQLLDHLKSAKPDLVLIGMGFPKQERLASRMASQLEHGFFIGEGGSFDYEELGGRIRRAPDWMQRLGLEWAWRLLQEPARIGRQMAIPQFIWRVWRLRSSSQRD